MRRIGSVFLAGPDRWFPDGAGLVERKRALCETAGFTPVVGGADGLVETQPSEAMAREIYARVLERLRGADALIANLTPWRGPGCDPATAFEAGFASALGKPVFAYLNVTDEDDAEHRDRVEALIGAAQDENGVWRDGDGCEIEDFGLAENLMLWAEARCLYVIVTPEPFEDLTGLELCLHAARLYSDES
jgi:nucleoside 2-deoxyribosyltransferase